MATALLRRESVGRLAALAIVLAVLVGGCRTGRMAADSPAASQPSALPASTIVPAQRVIAYPHGSWLLYGDGTAASPYAWVWVPAGASPPPPAPPAR